MLSGLMQPTVLWAQPSGYFQEEMLEGGGLSLSRGLRSISPTCLLQIFASFLMRDSRARNHLWYNRGP